MEIVSRRSGRNVLDMPFHLREVVRHVAAATGQIGRLGDTVQDDLLGGHSRRENRQHIPVIGEEKVRVLIEYLSHGELYPVVPGIRGMIRPAERLQ